MIFNVLKKLQASSGSVWWIQFNPHFLYASLILSLSASVLSAKQEGIYHRELEAYAIIRWTWRAKVRKATPDFQKI